MNLVILSSVPTFVIVMIVIESIAMMLIGGFLVFDIIRGKRKDRKKELELKYNKASTTLTLDEEEKANDFENRLAYLEKLSSKQKEYIDLLEKQISLLNGNKEEIKEEIESEETKEAEPEKVSVSEDEFDEFLNSIPEKVVEAKPIEKEEAKEEVKEEAEPEKVEPKRSVVISLSGLKKQSKAEEDKIKSQRLKAISEEEPEELEGEKLEESFNVKVYHHEELKLEIDEPGTIKVFTKGGLKKQSKEDEAKVLKQRMKDIEAEAPIELEDDDDFKELPAA